MPDKDPDGPSLELPSFGLGRKRKKKDAEPEATQPQPRPRPRPEATRPRPRPESKAEPEVQPEPEPEAATVPVPALARPAPDAAAQAPPESITQTLDPIASPPPPATDPEHAAAKPPRTGPLLDLGALPASVLTGVVVGLLTALLAYASQRLCEVVRSTSSCGGSGLLLLLAILVGMTLLGGALLRRFSVPEAGSTSVLAMGLLAVLVLLFLIDAAFSPLMFVVIPLLSAGCYAAAHYVTRVSTTSD